jgi:hypothetical protein
VLSTLNREHRFFAKDYTPTREELGNRGKPRKEPEPPLRVDLFYKNLPQHLGRKIPRFIRGPDDEQTDEEEDGDNGSVEDVFGEVHDGRQQPIRNKVLGHGAGKGAGGIEVVGIQPGDQRAAGGAEGLIERIGGAGVATAHQPHTRIKGSQFLQQLEAAIAGTAIGHQQLKAFRLT